MIILGIDASLNSTGYSVLDNDKIIAYGVIHPDKYNHALLFSSFDSLINMYKPDAIHLEAGFMSFKNSNTDLLLAEARGAVKAACFKHKKEVIEFAPSNVKKQITNDGKCDKKEIYNALCELYKDDEKFLQIGSFSEKQTKITKKTGINALYLFSKLVSNSILNNKLSFLS